MSDAKERLAIERSKILEEIRKHCPDFEFNRLDNNNKENNADNCANNLAGPTKSSWKQGEVSAHTNNGDSKTRASGNTIRSHRVCLPIDYNNSDLSYDEITILDDTSELSSISMISNLTEANQHISFNPTKMAGHSTQCKKSAPRSNLLGNTTVSAGKTSSIDEILATCFSDKARSLRDSLNVYSKKSRDFHDDKLAGASSAHSGLHNTSDFGFSGTADLSLASQSDMKFQASICGDESFVPAELMKSQLLNDEISWDEHCAQIPKVALSDEARQKISKASESSKWQQNDSLVSSARLPNDSNSSVGQFFGVRSVALDDFRLAKSPKNFHNPMTLISEDSVSLTVSQSDISGVKSLHGLTGEIPNKTYIVPADSSEESSLLSLSAINRALEQIDFEKDNSAGVYNKLMHNAKSQKKRGLPHDGHPEQSLGKASLAEHIQEQDTNRFSEVAKLVLENKENIDPYAVPAARPNDTLLSYTESLLHATSGREKHSNEFPKRLPLSPIRVETDYPDQYNDDIETGTDEPPFSSPTSSDSFKKCYKSTEVAETARKAGTGLPAFSFSAESLHHKAAKPAKCPNLANPGSRAHNRLMGTSPCSAHTTSSPNRTLVPTEIPCDTSITPTRSSSSSSNGRIVTRSPARSSMSSEFSHRDGKLLPLKATALKLSWVSTALRTVSRKHIQIKNTSYKRLVVRTEIHGPGFQLANVDGNILTLQKQECRTISINFCPTVVGPAIGYLAFVPPKSRMSFANIASNTMHDINVCIPLFGYGGHTCVNIKGIIKGPIGSPFLPMGNFHDLLKPLEKTVVIKNKGSLAAFAVVDVDSAGLPSLCNAFKFSPDAMNLAPGESIAVRLVFQPSREDFKQIKNHIQDVLVLAKMRVIYGNEANRQRMRQLIKGLAPEECKRVLPKSFLKLRQTLPGEYILKALDNYDEDMDVVQDLMSSMLVQEVDLTLNYDPLNESIAEISTMFSADSDTSLLFRTVCARSPSSSPRQLSSAGSWVENFQNSAKAMSAEEIDDCNAVATTESCGDSNKGAWTWSVSPKIVALDLKQPLRTSFSISNHFKKQMHFAVTCNRPNMLHFTPADGYIGPDGSQAEVAVREHELFEPLVLDPHKKVFIEVHVGSERIKIPVRISGYMKKSSF